MDSRLCRGPGAAVEGRTEGAVEGRTLANGRPAPESDRGSLRYCRVIAWERIVNKEGDPALRAWLNGNPPVRSDHWNDEVGSYFVNHFTDQKPENGRNFNWA